MLLFMLAVLYLIGTLCGQKSCDLSVCNYAGSCQDDNGESTCTCVGTKSFTGAHCDVLVNNCQPNPCFNSAPCTSVLGLYVCGPCPVGFVGTKCSFKGSDFMTKLYLHYNRVGYYGDEQIFLITVETLGRTAFGLELTTDNYQIEAFKTFSNDPLNKFQWQRSANLMQEARNLNLREADRMPYNSGYFHVARGVFWKTGIIKITMVAFDDETATKLFHNFQYDLLILLPDGVDCVPQISFPHCSNPQELLSIDITRFNIFELNVLKSCGDSSLLRYRWAVYTALGTSALHHFCSHNAPMLKTPPYFFWFNTHREALQVYTIQVVASEETSQGLVHTMARCYIFVMTMPVLAVITGGTKRSIYVYEPFVLDGTESRDFALPPNAPQRMIYRWDCSSSDDPSNAYCRTSMDNAVTLHVPANALKENKIYAFNLTVRSEVNLYSSSATQQVVTAVTNRRPLYVGIKCLRNCLMEKFIPAKLLHLQAQCLSCSPTQSAVNYTWRINGINEGSAQRYITYTTPNTPTLKVEVTVHNEGEYGSASVILKLNKPPSGGHCHIEPSSGEEYNTTFTIECSDYEDVDLPLLYEYVTADLTLERTNDPSARVRLPQTSSVKVIVCDFLYACTETELPVSVTPLTVPVTVSDMQQFLSQPDNDLQQLLHKGNSERFIVLVDAIFRETTSLSVADYVYNQLRQLKLQTLLEVEQMTNITQRFVANMKPLDYLKAALLANLLEKLVTGFKIVVLDGEIQEIQPENYKVLTDQISSMYSDFAVQHEKILSPQNMPPSLLDVDAPLQLQESDFDVKILQRINAWMRASRALNSLLELLGVPETNMHYPGEQPLIVNDNDYSLQVYSIEGTQAQQIQSKDNAVSITLQSDLLAELQKQLQSEELLLQILFLGNNPFWWYPTAESMSTNIFYFSVYSKQVNWHENLKLKQPLTFSLKRVSTAEPESEPTDGTLHSYWQMRIYTVIMPLNSLLVVKFIRTSEDVHIELRIGMRPNSFQVERSRMRVSADDKNITFSIANCKKVTTRGYIAVRAAYRHSTDVSFSFITELRQCLSFDFTLKQPRWTSCDCVPVLMGNETDNVGCYCSHLSNFAGRVTRITAAPVSGDTALLERVPINWYMILFYAVLVSSLFLLYIIARKDVHKQRDQLVTELRNEDTGKDFNIQLLVCTGAKSNAGTTANVSFTFVMLDGPPREFTIYQNPGNPQLTRNSLCTLRLPLSTDELALPLKINIHRDNEGRYPSWYCESIQLIDLSTKYNYTFKVRQWISEEATPLTELPKFQNPKKKKSMIFLHYWKRLCVHWFQFQPLFGPWRYADMPLSRFERTCIWIAKLSVSICIVACYFGRTTLETYEDERQYYRSLKFDPWHIFLLCIACHVAGLIVQYGLEYLIAIDADTEM